jgi:competence protein ComEA
MFRKLFATVFAALLFAVSAGAWAAVDVNRANQAELETVKGIGPGLSGKILKAREAGAFKSWADMIERVSGVGPGNAAKFSQAGLTVGSAAFDASSLPATETKASKGRAGAKAKGAGDGSSATQGSNTAEAAEATAASGAKPARAPKANRKTSNEG